MEFYESLSDQELAELDQLLMAESMPEAAMDTAMLDGFLTALVIGPNTVLPERWLPVVWGETESAPVRWTHAQTRERITGLIFRHLNWIINQLTHDPDHYEPLLYVNEVDGEAIPVIDAWCCGFVKGIELSADDWELLTQSEELQPVLMPIYLYGTDAGSEALSNNAALRSRHGEFADMLSDCVLAIREFWLPMRKRATTLRHDQVVPGRNDPCLCGSGQKYKKCCGSPTRAH